MGPDSTSLDHQNEYYVYLGLCRVGFLESDLVYLIDSFSCFSLLSNCYHGRLIHIGTYT